MSRRFRQSTAIKIGELARETGLTIRTIRYYEELGLLEPFDRSEGGFRLFSKDDVYRIKLVHYLKSMNLPLVEIKELCSSKKHGTTMGQVVKKILSQLDQYAEEAERQIERYQRIKADLENSRTILEECADCDRFPGDVDCANCEIITSHVDYPLLVRLIF
ncbi:MAG: MerR family transcriptional regulator [bacterium]